MSTIRTAKPCPFCGSKKIKYVNGEGGWFIGCRDNCNALIGDSHSKKKLLERWNNRPKEQPHAK